MSFENFPVPATPHNEQNAEPVASLLEDHATTPDITPKEAITPDDLGEKLDKEYVVPLNELAKTDTTTVVRAVELMQAEYYRLTRENPMGNYYKRDVFLDVLYDCLKAVAPELYATEHYPTIRNTVLMLHKWSDEEANMWEAGGKHAENRKKFSQAFRESCAKHNIQLDIDGL